MKKGKQSLNKNNNNVEKNKKHKNYKWKRNENYSFYNSDKMKKDVTRKKKSKNRDTNKLLMNFWFITSKFMSVKRQSKLIRHYCKALSSSQRRNCSISLMVTKMVSLQLMNLFICNQKKLEIGTCKISSTFGLEEHLKNS